LTLLLLVYLGGVLTILSPCILPVLPFVFARAERRFIDNGLPLLLGMIAAFAAIATLAAVGGAWAVRVNEYGRVAALLLLTVFAVTLLSTRLADWLARPFVAMGNRLTESSSADAGGGWLRSLLLGVATGLLWAPCAGPILGLILTGAALSGPSAHTTLLLVAYAAGAATSLAVALLAGGRVFALLKRSLGAGEWLRRALGVLVLLGVFAILMGWDSSILTRLSLNGTNSIEQSLIDKLQPTAAVTGKSDLPRAPSAPGAAPSALPVEGTLPPLAGATAWLNSAALTPEALRGKVVLIDFWTYSCINCLRALPYIKSWYEKYKDQGFVVIGVHAPEFAFEKNLDNVKHAVADLKITYPVALDNDFSIWQSFNNQYWPAHYFIDAEGRIRAHHFGEGEYEESEQIIRQLLSEAGPKQLPAAGADLKAAVGVQAAPDSPNDRSPETYVGYGRGANFASRGGFARDRTKVYGVPPVLKLNEWALAGSWQVDAEHARLQAAPGRIEFRFMARDLHVVLGPGDANRPVRFRVSLDGKPLGEDHGVDTDAAGNGKIDGQRLYQLIRQQGPVSEHTFSIEFLDAGAQAYAFTFG
jgi:cytochrome c biogenesis protein CcdA/thiol-disulfide isomerase/thioredoxin